MSHVNHLTRRRIFFSLDRMRYLAALTMSLICFQAIAQAAERQSAAAAYTERIGAIVNRLIDSELAKHAVRLNAFEDDDERPAGVKRPETR